MSTEKYKFWIFKSNGFKKITIREHTYNKHLTTKKKKIDKISSVKIKQEFKYEA